MIEKTIRSRGFIGLGILAALAVGIVLILADRGTLPDFITGLYRFPYGDKVGHFCLMGGLALCVNLALRARQVTWFKLRLLLGSLVVAGLVTLEEFSQSLFPTRSFDLLDLSASLLGILVLGRLALLFRLRSGSD